MRCVSEKGLGPTAATLWHAVTVVVRATCWLLIHARQGVWHHTLCRTYGRAPTVPVDEMKSRRDAASWGKPSPLLQTLEASRQERHSSQIRPAGDGPCHPPALCSQDMYDNQQDKHNHRLHWGLCCGLHSCTETAAEQPAQLSTLQLPQHSESVSGIWAAFHALHVPAS